jgi:hypothetical protein
MISEDFITRMRYFPRSLYRSSSLFHTLSSCLLLTLRLIISPSIRLSLNTLFSVYILMYYCIHIGERLHTIYILYISIQKAVRVWLLYFQNNKGTQQTNNNNNNNNYYYYYYYYYCSCIVSSWTRRVSHTYLYYYYNNGFRTDRN